MSESFTPSAASALSALHSVLLWQRPIALLSLLAGTNALLFCARANQMGIIAAACLVMFAAYLAYVLCRRFGLARVLFYEMRTGEAAIDDDGAAELLSDAKRTAKFAAGIALGTKLDHGLMKVLYEMAVWGFFAEVMRRIGRFWVMVVAVNGVLLVPGLASFVRRREEAPKESGDEPAEDESSTENEVSELDDSLLDE